ncbi:MAG: hypothetical protein AVDCRST_MAG40-3487, partial [uncultured Gemmatimonadaceae bacterium]
VAPRGRPRRSHRAGALRAGRARPLVPVAELRQRGAPAPRRTRHSRRGAHAVAGDHRRWRLAGADVDDGIRTPRSRGAAGERRAVARAAAAAARAAQRCAGQAHGRRSGAARDRVERRAAPHLVAARRGRGGAGWHVGCDRCRVAAASARRVASV